MTNSLAEPVSTNSARVPPPVPKQPYTDRDRLIQRARALSFLSVAYMLIEGALAITAAIPSGSVALLGWGLDSLIECCASALVIWRFNRVRHASATAEKRAQQIIAISFFVLAAYLVQDAGRAFIDSAHPAASWIGIGLSISSVLVMPPLARTTRRTGSALGSAATIAAGAENMLCAWLAAGVLVSVGLNAAFRIWWADPIVALAIAVLAVNEGREARQTGETDA